MNQPPRPFQPQHPSPRQPGWRPAPLYGQVRPPASQEQPQPTGRRGLWLLLTVFGTALLVTAALIVALLPSKADRTAAEWRIDADPQAYRDLHERDHTVEATWVRNGQLIRAGETSIQSIDPRTGSIGWDTPIPPHKLTICTASVDTHGGPIAVLTIAETRERECTTVMVFDLDTGEVLQQFTQEKNTVGRPLVDTFDDAFYLANPSYPVPKSRMDALGTVERKTATGDTVWEAKIPKCFEVNDIRASATQILVIGRCDSVNQKDLPYVSLTALDAATGAVLWSEPVEETLSGFEAVLISADPPVLAHSQTDLKCCHRQRFDFLDDNGAVKYTVDKGDHLAAGLGRDWGNRFHIESFGIVGDTVIFGNWPDGSTAIEDRQFIGMDLATGQERWRTALPEGFAPELVGPIHRDAQAVHIYNRARPQLFRLDPATGNTSKVADLEAPVNSAIPAEGSYFSRLIDGMLILTPTSRHYDTDAVGYRVEGD